jgi:2,3-bisphosphoglycerate-dependent phosphoglycerate mutase
MLTLWIARHGETDWNRAGRYQGQRDVPLNATGRAQAYALAARLAEESITAAYTSDLTRCAETARIIGKTPIIPDARLREPDYGDFTGLTYADMRTLAPDIYDQWQADRSDTPPHGEPVANVINRSRAFVADVKHHHAGRAVLVVTHGETLALLLCDLLQVPLSSWRQYATANASLTTLALHGNRAELIHFNSTEHLV